MALFGACAARGARSDQKGSWMLRLAVMGGSRGWRGGLVEERLHYDSDCIALGMESRASLANLGQTWWVEAWHQASLGASGRSAPAGVRVVGCSLPDNPRTGRKDSLANDYRYRCRRRHYLTGKVATSCYVLLESCKKLTPCAASKHMAIACCLLGIAVFC